MPRLGYQAGQRARAFTSRTNGATRRANGRYLCLIAILVTLLSPITIPLAHAKSIIVLGDSISAGYGMTIEEGWVNLLQQRLDHQCPQRQLVINASMSGETAAGAISRLPHLLATHQPDVVIIELGGNDGLRGQPPAIIERNLERLVVMTQEAGATPVLLGMKIPPNYGSSYSQAFEQNYVTIAQRHEVSLLPFFMAGVAGDETLMQADGIHPRVEGQAILLDNVWPLLQEVLNCPEEGAEPPH